VARGGGWPAVSICHDNFENIKNEENQRMNKAKRVAWQKHRIKAKKRKEKQRQEQKAGMAATRR
jgi:hypothetical protein